MRAGPVDNIGHASGSKVISYNHVLFLALYYERHEELLRRREGLLPGPQDLLDLSHGRKHQLGLGRYRRFDERKLEPRESPRGSLADGRVHRVHPRRRKRRHDAHEGQLQAVQDGNGKNVVFF